MVIIVEGCDKTGKSSLVAHLAAATGARVVKCGPPVGDPVAEYVALAASRGPFIADRFHLGELVYGPLYRGTSTSPIKLAVVEAALRARGAVGVLMDDNEAAVALRFAHYGETLAAAEDAGTIVRAFRTVVGWSTLPWIRLTWDPSHPDDVVARALAHAAKWSHGVVDEGPNHVVGPSAAAVWRACLARLLAAPRRAARGLDARELTAQHLTVLDPTAAVIGSPARRLNQAFAAAECAWVLAGQNRLDGIERFNSRLAPFADHGADGRTFFGAYGPPIVNQLGGVIDELRSQDSRRAVLTTWRQNPPNTTDVPCTVMMHFMARDETLTTTTYMRSNDVWLGFPYDVQLFSRIHAYVAAVLGLEVGPYHHVVGSLHLYERDVVGAERVLDEPSALCGGRRLKAVESWPLSWWRAWWDDEIMPMIGGRDAGLADDDTEQLMMMKEMTEFVRRTDGRRVSR